MRIDAYNKIEGIYNNSNVKRNSKINGQKAKDSIEISQVGRAYQIAKKALAETPDIRQDMVDQIRENIKNGSYELNMDKVADYMVDQLF